MMRVGASMCLRVCLVESEVYSGEMGESAGGGAVTD